ncbi:hypothetical protein T4A_4692 [Trichinella pseudospiralis]|uniref:Uncharacterized protein n=1 Tax=Trichinella pseudospiralis TaxID=6337 RepID=A0A0V1DRG4_TRIPS|nr:hypothetical protein T4A_4692 [Trichinella pseudospiralis]
MLLHLTQIAISRIALAVSNTRSTRLTSRHLSTFLLPHPPSTPSNHRLYPFNPNDL